MPSVLLIHGGLWEDIGTDWFWRRTGVVDGLAARGFTVIAPGRLRRAPSWAVEASHIAADPGLPGGPMTVVGGSFGCAVAARLALDFPGLVGRLVLAWPAWPAISSPASGSAPGSPASARPRPFWTRCSAPRRCRARPTRSCARWPCRPASFPRCRPMRCIRGRPSTHCCACCRPPRNCPAARNRRGRSSRRIWIRWLTRWPASPASDHAWRVTTCQWDSRAGYVR